MGGSASTMSNLATWCHTKQDVASASDQHPVLNTDEYLSCLGHPNMDVSTCFTLLFASNVSA